MIRKVLPLGLIIVGALFLIDAAKNARRPALTGALEVIDAADSRK